MSETATKHSALLRLGNVLVEGPDTIHSKDGSGSSHLSSSCSLFWHDSTFTKFRSCRIYCDGSGDDDSGFLPPLVRIAEWERHEDLAEGPPAWPHVLIDLLQVPLDCPEIQREVSRVQALADSNRLTTFGLPTRRNFGDAELGSFGHLRIEAHAGMQTISRAFWLSEAEDCCDLFDSMISVARSCGSVADRERWVERYDRSLDDITTGASWVWNYETGVLPD